MNNALLTKIIIGAFCLSFLTQSLHAEEKDELGWTTGLKENLIGSFTGTNLLFHGAGIASTPIIVKSGIDAQVRDNFRYNKNVAALPGAIIASGVGALITVSALHYSGSSANDPETLGAAYVVAQASLITVSYVMLLKATTGRAHPTNTWDLSSQDQSEQWQFGFLRNGLTSYGWPSGHVSHTVAVTSALAYYYPHKPWLTCLSVGLSTYMLYTVVAHDSGQMHWFSDGVAGAFMGYAIGSTIGKNFRSRIDGTAEKASSISVLPMITQNLVGATVNIELD